MRVTVPVNIDQKARRRMAARAQILYRPRPNRAASAAAESFFVVGRSSSFISLKKKQKQKKKKKKKKNGWNSMD